MTSQLSAKSPSVFAIEESTIAQLQQAMANGTLSAVDLVTYYIQRIEQFNPALNAFISVNRKAIDIAAELDKERSQGTLRGSLHGIPIVIKDNINTADLPTTGGCAALADLQPATDAFVVARLKAAGAVVLGKANLHELACSGESVSSLGGQVRNPYGLNYTPGGSSGGTAAAIAANLAVCGLGSDTINSVRSPASACSIVGLRPTSGRVSRSGLMPVSLTQDVIGPMGRTVSDVAMLLSIISADDPDDPMTARSVGHPSGPISTQAGSQDDRRYESALTPEGLVGKRLGIVPSLWGKESVHTAVNQVIDEAIATMEQLGAQTVQLAAHIDITQMLAELSLNIWEGKLHLNAYLDSLGEAAPIKTLTALLETGKSTGKIHDSIVPTLEAMEAIDTPLGSEEYWQRLYPRRVELRQRVADLFSQYRIDALVYPHQRQPVARIGDRQEERNGFLAAACGFPAITFPAGFASVAESSGASAEVSLPVGIELMAQPFEEGKLLQMAYAYEQHAQVRRCPTLSLSTSAESAVSDSTVGTSKLKSSKHKILETKASETRASETKTSETKISKLKVSESKAPKRGKPAIKEQSATDKTDSQQNVGEAQKTDQVDPKPKRAKPKIKRTKNKNSPSSES